MANVGFIGLGIMGSPMAGHLIKGGHRVFLHSRRGVPQALTDAGGIACSNSGDVAQKADVVILMVPDTPHVEDVLFGEHGVAKGLSEGKIVVDMSSISPLATKAFAQKINALGCEYLDAPVSGGEVGAKGASLTIMVGGSESAFATVKPLFDLMGKNITLVGGNGDGQTTKVANQIIVVCGESRRGSGESAAGADGRLRIVADPRSARRAHAEAHVRAGLSYRVASEGFESRADDRPRARRRVAQHGDVPGVVHGMRGQRWCGVGPLGARTGARKARELRDRSNAAGAMIGVR
jgi:2-hydroxy-3-oxopropionate reductase